MLRVAISRIGDHVRVDDEEALVVVLDEIITGLRPVPEIEASTQPDDGEDTEVVVRFDSSEHLLEIFGREPSGPRGLDRLTERLHDQIGRIRNFTGLVAEHGSRVRTGRRLW